MKKFLYLLFLIPTIAHSAGQMTRSSFGTDYVVGLYHLNEGAATGTQDASGNGNGGVNTGGCVWVGGKFGSGVQCTGSGKYIAIGNESNFDFVATDAFYIVLHFKVFPGGVSGPVIAGKSNTQNQAGYRFLQQVGALNDLAWKVTDTNPASCSWVTGNLTLTSDMNVFDGKWHTLIGWWDGSNACTYNSTTRMTTGGGLYIDGKLPAVTLTGTGPLGTITNNVVPSIGGSPQASTDFTNGTVDEVAFVRGKMTPEKAKRIHALFQMSDQDDSN